MIPTVLNTKFNSNREVRAYTDYNMLNTTKIYKNVLECNLEKKINAVLQKKDAKWLEEIFDLLENENHNVIKGLSDYLIILNKLCDICEKEYVLRGKITLSKFSSLEEIKEVYQETVFYLRRMELEMDDKETHKEFLYFISDWDFSIEYLIMVLEKGAIYDKVKTGGKLADLFIENGNEEYSKQILKYLNAEEL